MRQQLRASASTPTLYDVLDASGAVVGAISRPRPDHWCYHVLKKTTILGARSLRQLRVEIREHHAHEATP